MSYLGKRMPLQSFVFALKRLSNNDSYRRGIVPRKDHAVIMARFSNDCMKKMTEISRELESVFGNDTADLCLRIGLHSGPVTAGMFGAHSYKTSALVHAFSHSCYYDMINKVFCEAIRAGSNSLAIR